MQTDKEEIIKQLLSDLEYALETIWKLSNYSGDMEWVKTTREKYKEIVE